jgi:hypothetical protein
MLLDPGQDTDELPEACAPAKNAVALVRAGKPRIRPENMRSEELAALIRGFDADTVARFTDFKQR